MLRVEELTKYFQNNGYKVETINHNRLEVTKDGYKDFYLKIIAEDEITVLKFTISSKDFSIEFDNYVSQVKLFADFSTNNQITIQYSHPFLFLHLDTEEFSIRPVTSLVTSLLVQLPVSGELIEDVRRITKELDKKIRGVEE